MQDIIDVIELENGFVAYHDDSGYWIGIRNQGGIIDSNFPIDREAYNSIKKRERCEKKC